MTQQLTLGIRLRDDATFENFFVGPNQVVVDCLRTASEKYIYIWGNQGSGRSHLLQAACHAAESEIAIYLSLSDESMAPDVLQDLENIDLLALDNLQAIAGNAVWEEALFHCYNRLMQSKTRFVIGADDAPQQLGVRLPDLQSRLAAGVTFQLQALNDSEKLQAIQLRAQKRGLDISNDIGRYLINHYPRDMHALYSALEKLDEAAMIEQRRITVPFVKKTLAS